MGYFDTSWTTNITFDASPFGLGATLWQSNPANDSDIRLIYFASKTLSDVEGRYSKFEKEEFSAVWGCEKFHMYLFGANSNSIQTKKVWRWFYITKSLTPELKETLGLSSIPVQLLSRACSRQGKDYLNISPDFVNIYHQIPPSVERLLKALLNLQIAWLNLNPFHLMRPTTQSKPTIL